MWKISYTEIFTESPPRRENWEDDQKIAFQGKHKEFEKKKKIQNTGNFVCSSCKFTDSKTTGYHTFCLTFLKSVSYMELSQIAKNVTGPIFSWTGKTQGICR